MPYNGLKATLRIFVVIFSGINTFCVICYQYRPTPDKSIQNLHAVLHFVSESKLVRANTTHCSMSRLVGQVETCEAKLCAIFYFIILVLAKLVKYVSW